jgi:hypothetical protein
MCDYSLEIYRSRPAVTGERYETHRFTSGSIGFVSPGAPDVAVCMACDTRLEVAQIPSHVQARFGVADSAAATFVRIEGGPHHDGVRFPNGAEVTLQQLGPGVAAIVVDALTTPRKEAARPRELAEVH